MVEHGNLLLDRFLEAQEQHYERAIDELNRGKKESHWMWFIFPQLQGIGYSPVTRHYAISGIHEAATYLNHPVLGQRLLEIFKTVLAIEGKAANDIFGSPDDKKLHACSTLFAHISHADSIFEKTIDKYFNGEKHAITMRILVGD